MSHRLPLKVLHMTCSRRCPPTGDGGGASLSGAYGDAIILNFANCDMVGHTGIYEGRLQAVTTVDECG